MQENREKFQEMYQHENKPPLLGHVEQVTAESTKTEIESEQPSDQPLEQPSSSQQEKSVLLTDPEEQLMEALQEQERWEQLQEHMGAGDGDGNSRPKEKEASDLDLEAEMEREAPVTSTSTDQRGLASSTTTDQQTGGDEPDQRDLTGVTAESELQETDYSKQYRTGPQDRSDRSAARREKQERDERERVK